MARAMRSDAIADPPGESITSKTPLMGIIFANIF